MYATIPEAEVAVYADHWRKERYRVELTAALSLDLNDVGAALEKRGYEPIDIDQWGQSYRHREYRLRTVELDENEFSAAPLQLTLQYENLAETALDATKSDMVSEFERIYRLIRDPPVAGEDLPGQYYHGERENFRLHPNLQYGPLGLDI